MTADQPLWEPAEQRVQASQMYTFMTRMSKRYGFTADWASLHRWSITRRGEFWQNLFEFAGIECSRPATAVEFGSGMLDTRWFTDLKFNFAAQLLRFDDQRVAVIAENERGVTRSITYQELRRDTARLAAAMRQMGIGPGDRVVGFLPNIPEAVIGMLAAASIGAIWSSCSPDFGINGIFDRFGQIEPKLLICADGYTYNGKRIESLDRVQALVDRIPSIQKVVVVPFLDHAPDVSTLSGAILWPNFLADEQTLVFEQTPFDHPLYIMYSSGTTGVPKCIVHGAGGTLLQHMKELMLHCDLSRDDTIMYYTTCGWMMWNWLISSLAVGATVVLYEGSPAYPAPGRLWEVADRVNMTVLGTSPKYLSACEKAGIVPRRDHKLDKLRAILSTGSPLTIENFHWVYDCVKADLQLSSICGGTDIISCFMLGNPILPVYAGEIQCLGLGMDVRAFDADGCAIVGRQGELVCCSPFPSQPTGFWKDPDGSKYRSAYFERYPGIWHHGDYVEITERGGVIVYGRSDATLNPGGVRIGTAEIYRQVEAMDEVVDSVVVGRKTADADVDICLFVVLRDGATLSDELVDRIKARIAAGATKRHVPKYVKQVTSIPYTISGKKVELAVANMIHGQPVTNEDALANPESLAQYANILTS